MKFIAKNKIELSERELYQARVIGLNLSLEKLEMTLALGCNERLKNESTGAWQTVEEVIKAITIPADGARLRSSELRSAVRESVQEGRPWLISPAMIGKAATRLGFEKYRSRGICYYRNLALVAKT